MLTQFALFLVSILVSSVAQAGPQSIPIRSVGVRKWITGMNVGADLGVSRYCAQAYGDGVIVIATLIARDGMTPDDLDAIAGERQTSPRSPNDIQNARNRAQIIVEACAKKFRPKLSTKKAIQAWYDNFAKIESHLDDELPWAKAKYLAKLIEAKALNGLKVAMYEADVVPACKITAKSIAHVEASCHADNHDWGHLASDVSQIMDIMRDQASELNAPVTDFNQALAVIGSTAVGRKVLAKFLPRYRAGKLKIKILPDGGVDGVCGIYALACFDRDEQTIYVSKSRNEELGAFLPELFHEIVHSVDDAAGHEKGVLRAKLEWLKKLDAKNRQQAELLEKIDRLVFQLEKRAYSAQYELIGELRKLYPCYDGFTKAIARKIDDRGNPKMDLVMPTDEELAAMYWLDPNIVIPRK